MQPSAFASARASSSPENVGKSRAAVVDFVVRWSEVGEPPIAAFRSGVRLPEPMGRPRSTMNGSTNWVSTSPAPPQCGSPGDSVTRTSSGPETRARLYASYASLSSLRAGPSIASSPACGSPDGILTERSTSNVFSSSHPVAGSMFACRWTPAIPDSLTFGPAPWAKAFEYSSSQPSGSHFQRPRRETIRLYARTSSALNFGF